MRRAVAVILTGLLVLAGCGEKKRETVPVADLVAAVDQTRAAPSQRIHMDIDMSGIGLDSNLHMTGDGVVDNKTHKGRMTLDMSDLTELAGGTPSAGDGIAEEIIDGFTVWMRWPPFAKQVGTDKEWVKLDLQKLGKQQGFDFSALAGGQGDPTQQLDELRAASDGVEVVGNETVRGVATTHYKATIDLERYPDVAAPADRDRVRRSVERLIELTGQKKVPTEVWIGHKTRRVHKMRVQTKVKIPNSGASLQMDQTMELYDFGVPVGDIKPPPASDTVDAADLAAGRQSP
jgi:predicted small lipoprotein YifL